MRRLMRSAIAGAAVLASVLVPGSVGADPGEATHVDGVEAVVSGTLVSVSGSSTFVDVPVVVAQDPSGDAAAAGVGLDVTTATFSRPDPASPTLRLVVGVADQVPAVFGAPTTLYHYPVAVNGEIASCGGGTGFWFPEARIASILPAAATPTFRLMCDLSPGGVATGPDISGQIGGGTVSWTFSMSQIGAVAGDTLSNGGDCVDPGTTSSPPGAAWLCNNGGGDGVVLDDYVIPGATVALGVAPAGTPTDAVPVVSSATVTPSSGAFTGSVPAPGTPGEYVVVAEACYGPGNCGRLATETFTIG